MSPDTGLTNPMMGPEKLGRSLQRYLSENRPADVWVALMEQTEALGLSEDEVGLMADTFNEQGDDRQIFTPRKRRNI
jgi:hypothetical protein